jgi:hypothetical protein
MADREGSCTFRTVANCMGVKTTPNGTMQSKIRLVAGPLGGLRNLVKVLCGTVLHHVGDCADSLIMYQIDQASANQVTSLDVRDPKPGKKSTQVWCCSNERDKGKDSI